MNLENLSPRFHNGLRRLWLLAHIGLSLAMVSVSVSVAFLATPRPCYGPGRVQRLNTVPKDWPTWPLVARGEEVSVHRRFFLVFSRGSREVWRFGPYHLDFFHSTFKGSTFLGPTKLHRIPSCGDGAPVVMPPRGHPGNNGRLRRNPHTGNYVFSMDFPGDSQFGVGSAFEIEDGLRRTQRSRLLLPVSLALALLTLASALCLRLARPFAGRRGVAHWQGGTISAQGDVRSEDGDWIGNVHTRVRAGPCIIRQAGRPSSPSRRFLAAAITLREAETASSASYREAPAGRRLVIAKPLVRLVRTGQRWLFVALAFETLVLLGGGAILVFQWW